MLQIRSLLFPSLIASLLITGAAAFEEQDKLPSLAESDPARARVHPIKFYSLGKVTLEGNNAQKVIDELPQNYYYTCRIKQDKINLRSIITITGNNTSNNFIVKPTANIIAVYKDDLIISSDLCIERILPHNGKVVKTISKSSTTQAMLVHKDEVYISNSTNLNFRFNAVPDILNCIDKINVNIISNNLNCIDKMNECACIKMFKSFGDKIYAFNNYSLTTIDVNSKKVSCQSYDKVRIQDFENNVEGYNFVLDSVSPTIHVTKQQASYNRIVVQLLTGENPTKVLMHNNILYVQHSKGVDLFNFKESPTFESPIKTTLTLDNITSMFVYNNVVYIANNKNIYKIKNLGIADIIPLAHESMMVISGPNAEPCATPLLMEKILKKRVRDSYFSNVTFEFFR